MKNYLMACTLFIMLLVTHKVHAGGCLVDERIYVKDFISSHDECLEILVYPCGIEVVMTVANMCEETYIYSTKDGNIELLPYKSTPNDKLMDRKFPFSFSDKTIPQQFFNIWSRTLYKKNDPDHKIYVNAVALPSILANKQRIVIDSALLSWLTKIVPMFKFQDFLY